MDAYRATRPPRWKRIGRPVPVPLHGRPNLILRYASDMRSRHAAASQHPVDREQEYRANH